MTIARFTRKYAAVSIMEFTSYRHPKYVPGLIDVSKSFSFEFKKRQLLNVIYPPFSFETQFKNMYFVNQ